MAGGPRYAHVGQGGMRADVGQCEAHRADGPCRHIPTLGMQVDGCAAHPCVAHPCGADPCPRSKLIRFFKAPSSPTWACWADPSPSLVFGMKWATRSQVRSRLCMSRQKASMKAYAHCSGDGAP